MNYVPFELILRSVLPKWILQELSTRRSKIFLITHDLQCAI